MLERPFSSLRGSLRSAKDRIAEPHKFHRASSSLRRVLTDSSKRNKRPSVFGMLQKKDRLPRGPEEYLPDDEDGSRPSVLEQSSNRSTVSADSKGAGRRPILVDSTGREAHAEDTTPIHSSPIQIPKHSSPPAILFEIESGALSPRAVFGVVEPERMQDTPVDPQAHTASTPVKALPRILSRKRPKINQKTSDESDTNASHIPKRASNDHWRLRNISRKRSSQVDAIPEPVTPGLDVATPMPGTNLPLEDPFDTDIVTQNAKAMKVDTAQISGVDGAAECEPSLTAYAAACSEHLTKESALSCSYGPPVALFSHEVDPGHRVSRSTEISPRTSDEIQKDLECVKEILLAMRGDFKPVAPEQQAILETHGVEQIGPRADSALALMDARLRTIETYVQKISLDVLCREDVSHLAFPEMQEHDEGSLPNHSSLRDNPLAVLEQRRGEDFSDGYQSPLLTQDLFYPSDNEHHYSSDSDSALSSAQKHLVDMQIVAANGGLPVRTCSPPAFTIPSVRVLESLDESPIAEQHKKQSATKGLPKACHRELFETPQASFSEFDQYYAEFLAHHMNDGWTNAAIEATTDDEPQMTDAGELAGRAARTNTPVEAPIRWDEYMADCDEANVSPYAIEDRPDSACLIPVCNVCGGPDDHLCSSHLRLVSPEANKTELEEKAEATPKTGRHLIGRDLFDMIERSSPGATLDETSRMSVPRFEINGAKTLPSSSSRRPRKHRSARSSDFFSDDTYVRAAMEWETDNPFEILSDVKEDQSPNYVSSPELTKKDLEATKKDFGKIDKSMASERRALGTISANQGDSRKDRDVSFCSDTVIEHDLDAKDLAMERRTWNTFQPWN